MKALRTLRRLAITVSIGLVAAAGLAPAAEASTPAHAGWHPPVPPPVAVRIIAMNDFHGNLQPPTGSSGRVTLDDGKTTVNAGGAAYIAAWVKKLEAAAPHAFVISAGDNIGASPLASALFHDEPTIDFLNDIGLTASAVGNHELDEGYTELKRMQFGGCNPTDGCQFEPTFSGARFPFLAANIYFTNGRPAVLPFTIKFSGGIPIGIIGATLKDLPDVVLPTSIAGLEFGDEVTAIDRTSKLLDRLGIRAQIVTMHQGDESDGGGPNACNIEAGPATAIAKAVSPSIDAIFTGHTHQQYNCVINDPNGQPRPMIQGLSFGRLLSVVDLKVDPRTRDVIRSATVANNVIVDHTSVAPDPTVQALVDQAVTESAPIANQPVGTITADIVRAAPPSGEEPLGDVIADAQLAATVDSGAQIAITNPGGIRQDLTYAESGTEGAGVVTYGEAFNVQPFSNIMQTVTMTGAELDAVLEQQWQPQADGSTIVRILQISSSLHYTQSASQPIGSRISHITVGGVPVDPATSYRVSINNFLAAGGDGFTVFTQGTDLTGGPIDLDAFTAYLTKHPNLGPPPADRITYVA